MLRRLVARARRRATSRCTGAGTADGHALAELCLTVTSLQRYVRDELAERAATPRSPPASHRELLVLDPGLGFAKLPAHNWTLTAYLDRVVALGHPVLYAASRKGFLGKVGRGADDAPRPVSDRDVATAATSVLAAQAGAWAVRVHDVRSTWDALDVWEATHAARAAGGAAR
jgi:dihydropteroate synthase